MVLYYTTCINMDFMPDGIGYDVPALLAVH